MIRPIILFIILVRIICFAYLAEAADLLSSLARCREAHPAWSEKICANVTHGKVEKGITEEQVIASWGPPQRKFKFDAGHSYWHYPVKGDPSGAKIILHMKNGKVIDIGSKVKRYYNE
jgi:hypothetical protein